MVKVDRARREQYRWAGTWRGVNALRVYDAPDEREKCLLSRSSLLENAIKHWPSVP